MKSNRTRGRFMRARLASLALGCALAFALVGGVRRVVVRAAGDGANDAESSATREGRLRIFDEVWEQVRDRYFDPTMRGVDWQEARKSFRPRAAEARDESELYSVLRLMLGELRDPHTRVFAPGESTDWRVQHYVSVGIAVRELAGGVVVTDVERDSEASLAGLRAGDEIVSVDGTQAEALVERMLASQAAGDSKSARLLAVTRLFDGQRDTYVTVAFRRAGETRERTVVLQRETRTRKPSFEIRGERDGVRVVRFNLFTPEAAVEFARALVGKLKGARAIVIDLRDNGGGEADAMADFASTLLPAGVSLGRFTDREGRVRLEPTTRSVLLSSADSIARFHGRVVLLTNERTASAAEVFTAVMRESGRAVVVGEETCGCVLGIERRQQLPDGGVLDISETDYHTAAGERLEGAGLRPDIPAAPTREDLRRRHDRALEMAEQILKGDDERKSDAAASSSVPALRAPRADAEHKQ
jgi:carboxyl-terminal processing protease